MPDVQLEYPIMLSQMCLRKNCDIHQDWRSNFIWKNESIVNWLLKAIFFHEDSTMLNGILVFCRIIISINCFCGCCKIYDKSRLMGSLTELILLFVWKITFYAGWIIWKETFAYLGIPSLEKQEAISCITLLILRYVLFPKSV